MISHRVCPECGHEWSGVSEAAVAAAQDAGVRDANGNVLADGDSVIVIKDLKIKGSSSVVKGRHQVRNIRLRMRATATTSPARSAVSAR